MTEELDTEISRQMDDSDAAMSEYDNANQTDAEQPTSQQPNDEHMPDRWEKDASLDPRVDELYHWAQQQNEQRELEKHNQQFERDLNDSISYLTQTLKESIEHANLPEKWIRGWFEQEAQADPRLKFAWEHRHENPNGYQSALRRASRELVKEAKEMPDPDATADRELVASAVKAASSRQHVEEDFNESQVRKMGLNDMYSRWPELAKDF